MKIVIKGIVKQTSQWVDIAEDEVLEDATIEQVNEVLDQLRDVIGDMFKSGKSGQLTFNNSVINIQAFALIRVNVQE